MKRLVIYSAVFVFVACGLAFLLWAAGINLSFVKKQLGLSESEEGPRLVFKEKSLDFGKISQEKEAEYTFTFINTGDKTLKIIDVKTSCGCMAGLVSSNVIKPKKSGEIRVRLDPIGKKGRIDKTITIYSNDSRESKKEIYIYATVEHRVDIYPDLRMETVLFSGKCNSCHAERAQEKTGKDLYDAVCAYCHGAEGKGRSADPFEKRSTGYIRNWTANGKPGSGMAGFSKARGGPLGDSQIDSLVGYLKSIGPE